jgi:uncharacterized integral membrane protein
MHLRVDLTCPQVSSTRQRVYASQRWAFPDSGSTTLLRYNNCFLVFNYIYVVVLFFFMYFHNSSCVPLFFFIFRWSLLFLLFFVGFVVGDRLSTDLIWLSAMPVLQQPLNSDCYIYRNRFFAEFFCSPEKCSACMALSPIWSFKIRSIFYSLICTAFTFWALLLGCQPLL